MTKKISAALIGAGSMGGSLLLGWLNSGTIDAARSAVFDPGLSPEMEALCRDHGVLINPAHGDVTPHVMIGAIKPQMAPDILPGFSAMAENAIFLSVMAGRSIASLSSMLGNAPKVARTMPNLPAAVGKGVSGLYAPSAISDADRTMLEALMRAAGEVVWVETEEGIDFVTAVSGSGPAYYFLLTEALSEAGVRLGLTPEAAAGLARATLTGAGAFAENDARSPAEMRRAVTSPGGTTAAAIDILDRTPDGLRDLVEKAVAAAARRAGELTD
ncbi:MAG: pyrroline-5-carboxylate reductase [Pseudomonadota bacterium]